MRDHHQTRRTVDIIAVPKKKKKRSDLDVRFLRRVPQYAMSLVLALAVVTMPLSGVFAQETEEDGVGTEEQVAESVPGSADGIDSSGSTNEKSADESVAVGGAEELAAAEAPAVVGGAGDAGSDSGTAVELEDSVAVEQRETEGEEQAASDIDDVEADAEVRVIGSIVVEKVGASPDVSDPQKEGLGVELEEVRDDEGESKDSDPAEPDVLRGDEVIAEDDDMADVQDEDIADDEEIDEAEPASQDAEEILSDDDDDLGDAVSAHEDVENTNEWGDEAQEDLDEVPQEEIRQEPPSVVSSSGSDDEIVSREAVRREIEAALRLQMEDEMRAELVRQVRAQIEAEVRAELESAAEAVEQSEAEREAAYESRLASELERLERSLRRRDRVVVENFQYEQGFSDEECTLLSPGELYCSKGERERGARPAPEAYSDVYSATDDVEGDAEIFLHKNSRILQITKNATDDIAPMRDKVSGLIVWQGMVSERWQVFVYDEATGKTTQLTTTNHSSVNPRAGERTIVWQSWVDNSWDIFAAQLVREKWQISRVTDNSWNEVEPRVAAGYITWRSYVDNVWQVFAYNLRSGETQQISQGAGEHMNPRIAILWESEEQGELRTMQYDLSDGSVDLVASGGKPIVPKKPAPTTPTQENKAAIPAPTSTATSSKVTSDKPSGDDE